MEQLLLHLVGDYVTQTDWMAKKKFESFPAALLHAGVYSLPFFLITSSVAAVAVIFATHTVIDHYRLAKYLIYAKNWTTDRSLRWADCSATGYHKDTPPWLAAVLLFVVDNTVHLAINYAALRWL
jgi:glucan phosphoethanolaminetransferase (alkaline phosphatase superfamily)